jgi:hypothetical protein
VCTAAIGVVVITNTAAQPTSASLRGRIYFQVTLDDLSGIGAENEHLAQIGARVRIVPLESWCSLAGRSRHDHAAARRRGAQLPWIRSVSAAQAPAGETTIVLATQHGLAGATFQVHGRGPLCVPVIGTVRYW